MKTPEGVSRPLDRYTDLYSDSELDWNHKAYDFAAKHLEPVRAKIDGGGMCRELMHDLGAAGLLGTTIPSEFGGEGLDHSHNAVISEEISAVTPSLGAMRAVSGVFVAAPLLKFGTTAQAREWLSPVVDGSVSYSLGITEPGAGSDAGAISTVARRDGQNFVIDGVKHYISGGAENDAVLAYVATDPEAPPRRRLTAFLVPLTAAGVSIEPIETTGLRGFSHARLEFTRVHVGEERMIGELGQGFDVMMHGLEPERIDIAARAMGCARRSFGEAVDYALEREQFGTSISRFQGVSHKVADMRVWLDSMRLLVVRAARLYDQGTSEEQASAVAKLAAAEKGFAICDGAMQILGARGYASGSAADIMFRDIRALRFGGGTDEIMRHVIQREEFLSRKTQLA